MIKEDIKVEYLVRKDDGKIAFDLSEFNGWQGRPAYLVECYNRSRVFHSFKNNGQVSKSDMSNLAEVNRKAEELLKQRLQVKAETKADMQKAIKLAKIVNEANWDDNQPMVLIKIKTSHSKWYQHAGEFNAPSEYVSLVPVSVAKEAKELQSIRRKHQNDNSFDFSKSAYQTLELRVADHDNGNGGSYISEEQFEELQNDGEIKL